MTREEKQKAIYVLKNSAPVFPLKKLEEYNDYVQTINQVINWLEQEPTTKNDLAVDCIYRKQAQNKIKKICNTYGLSYEDGERKPATGGQHTLWVMLLMIYLL